ncbi:MAG: hypothetical protein IPH36_05935 [Saprospiraceae bacterium]|nr:hypothetical protein [Saprospiraceae bacterium]
MSINPINQKLFNNLNATFYSDTTNLKYWIENCVLLAVATYGNVTNYAINGPNIISEIKSGAQIPINKDINITYSIPGFNVLSRTHLLESEN